MFKNMFSVKEKKCSKCGVVKSLEEFYRDKSMKCGRSSSCKICRSKVDRARVYSGPPITEKVCGVCGINNPLSMFSKCKHKKGGVDSRCKMCYAEYRNSNKKAMAGYVSKYRAKSKNKRKRNAQNAVTLAVKNKKLPRIKTQTCRDCGNQAQEYHHHSYEEKHWVDVIPLCRVCHKAEHGRLEKEGVVI